MSITNPQATTPLTPPPSVTQENLLSASIDNKFADAFNSQAVFAKCLPSATDSGHTVTDINALELDMASRTVPESFKQPVNMMCQLKESLVSAANSKIGLDESGEDSGDEDEEFPKTLEELLAKQWTLGAELIAEQSQNFDGRYFCIYCYIFG
jgi:hypothetical protein